MPVFLIIADGSPERAVAEARLAALEALVWPIGLPEGYPRLVDSATIPGLEPGTFVVTLGACAVQGRSELLTDLARAVAPGAFVREVMVDEACPALAGSDAPAGREVLRVAADRTELVVTRPPDPDPSCPDSRITFAWIGRGGGVSHTLDGACQPGAGDDLGVSSRFEDPELVVVDGLTLLYVRERRYVMDVGTARDHLYGLACGRWRELVGPLEAGMTDGMGPMVEHTFDRVAPATIRVRRWEGPPSGMDTHRAPDAETTYRIEPRGCATAPG